LADDERVSRICGGEWKLKTLNDTSLTQAPYFDVVIVNRRLQIGRHGGIDRGAERLNGRDAERLDGMVATMVMLKDWTEMLDDWVAWWY
jgi:hypothetical protein